MDKIQLAWTTIEKISKEFKENHKNQIINTTIEEIKIVIFEGVWNIKTFACIEKTWKNESKDLVSFQRQPSLNKWIPENLEPIWVLFNWIYKHWDFKTERYHYVKEVLPEFRNKWIARLLLKIKESIDSKLTKDYSAKPSNMRFLMANWYWPTHAVIEIWWGETSIEAITEDLLWELFRFLNESKDDDSHSSFPVTIRFTKRD